MHMKTNTSKGFSSEHKVGNVPNERNDEINMPVQGSVQQVSAQQASPAELVDKLTAAIQAGEGSQAAALVEEIAKLRLKLDINIPKEDLEQRNKEKEFSVRVHVEDRESDGCYINLTVKACDTIHDLKRKVMLKHNFPVEVQRWIMGKKIPEDKVRLSQCGIKGPGHTLFLYLVTARSVGLTQQAYENQHKAVLEGRYIASSPSQVAPHSPRENSTDQSSWPPAPPSPTERRSHKYSNSPSPVPESSPVLGMGEVEHTAPSRQASKRSLSSGSSLIQDMLMSVNLSGMASTPPLAQSENHPKSGSSDSGVGNWNDNSGSGQRSRTPPARNPTENQPTVGWSCSACTFLNLPTRPGCEMCSASRPANYQVPIDYQMTPQEVLLQENVQFLERMTREAQEKTLLEKYEQFIATDNQDLVANLEPFECAICFDEIGAGQGITLRECLHHFCRDCLTDAVRHCEDAVVKCPYQDDDYSCQSVLQEREIKALVPEDLFLRFLQLGLNQAESQTSNSYHCKTADCHGWCIYEDFVNFFKCPVCSKENCLTCKAMHEGQNCKQYQDNLQIRAQNDLAAKQTTEMLQKLVSEGEAMHCPKCQVIVQKKGGCDWIKCSICKLEICWVTRGPRWGPGGEGDYSAGCKCRLGGRKCHPDCINCH